MRYEPANTRPESKYWSESELFDRNDEAEVSHRPLFPTSTEPQKPRAHQRQTGWSPFVIRRGVVAICRRVLWIAMLGLATGLMQVFAAAPMGFTEPATRIDNSKATLHGMANPNGSDSVAWFEWGTNTSYGNRTSSVSIGNGQSVVYVSSQLSGLTGDSYHARLVVSNLLGVAIGRDQILVTGQRVFAWGLNTSGQTNVPAGLSNSVAIAAGYSHSLALKNDGTISAWGLSTSGQTTIPSGMTNVLNIAAGVTHSLALKGDGTVSAWGNNTYGQISVPTGLSGVVAIAAEYRHNLALKTNGTVVTWGASSSGQGTIPATLTNVVAVAVGVSHSIALQIDGKVFVWGGNGYHQTNLPAGLSNIVAIAAGDNHNLALRADGTLFAWGDNTYGQTNIPAGLTNAAAIAAGTYESMAMLADSKVMVWGGNSYGQTNVPANVRTATTLAAGGNHMMALAANHVPAAVSKLVWGRRDVSRAIGLSTSDLDPDRLTLRLARLPDRGTLTQSAAYGGAAIQDTNTLIADPTGTVVFIPDSGTDGIPYTSFDYVANDTFADSAPATVTLNISPTNLIPVATNITASQLHERDTVVTLSAFDLDGDALSPRITGLPAGGALYQYFSGGRGALIANPDTYLTDASWRLIFAPATNAFGSPYTSFQFVANDGIADSAPATAWMNMTNTPPVATNTSVTGSPNWFKAVQLTGSDANGDALQFRISAFPQNGRLHQWYGGLPGPQVPTNGYIYDSGHRVIFWPATNSFGSSNAVFEFVTNDRFQDSVPGVVTMNIVGTPPTVQTQPAVLVDRNQATLNAAVNPNMLPTVAWFEWGLSTNYSAATPSSALGNGGGSLATNALIAGLSPNLIYHFRMAASNGVGTVYGADTTLQLLAPYVYTEPAFVQGGTACLRGMASPNLLPTTAWFEWGADKSYGHRTDPVYVGAGRPPVYVTNQISGFPVNWPWHYRLVASNSVAVINGNDQLCILGKQVVTWDGSQVVSTGLSNVVAIAIATYVGLNAALLADGTVTSWGRTNVPAGLSNIGALTAGSGNFLALKSDGTVIGWGFNGASVNNIPAGLGGVIDIGVGSSHGLALKSDGTLVAWGDNYYYQGSVPAGLSNVVAVACGDSYNMVRQDDGTIYGWGYNGVIQLGYPFYQFPDSMALTVGYGPIAVLRTNGTVVTWDYSTPEDLTTNVATDIVAIGSAFGHNLALNRQGKIFSWGSQAITPPAEVTNAVAVAGGIGFDVAVIQDLPPEVPSQLQITSMQLAGPHLQFIAAGTGSGTFYLLTSTNLSLPPALWLPMATNFLPANTAITINITNANVPGVPARYYILSTIAPAAP